MSFVTTSNSTTKEVIALMLNTVSNSGRKTLVAPLATQHHLANFAEHMELFIDAVIEGYGGASTANVDNSELLRAALINHILEVYYPEIQRLAPLVSSPSNLGAILDSHEPMWEVEKGEDFPFFRTVHYPQLERLANKMKSTLADVDVTSDLRYVPSYFAPDLFNFLSTDMKSRHSFQANSKRIKVLSETLGVEIDSTDLAKINQSLARMFGELKRLSDARAVTNLWELIVLTDRNVADNDQPMFCGTDVHMRLMHTAVSILPTDTRIGVPMSYVSAKTDPEDGGVHTDEHGKSFGENAKPLEGDIFEMMLIIAAKTAKGMPIYLNDITLPVSIHPIASTLTSVFKEGMKELLPDLKSEFLNLWLDLASKGAKTPVKYDDIRVKMDTALHMDRNNIPRAFDDHLFSMVGTLPEKLISKYVEKRSVYYPYIEAPLERTQFRVAASVAEIREKGEVRIDSEQPFSKYEDKTIKKRASTDEAFILKSKVDAGIVVDGQMATSVSEIVADLYKLKQPDITTWDREFSYRNFIQRLEADVTVGRTLDITTNGPSELRLSGVLENTDFQYKDDMVLFHEHGYGTEMSMPRTMVRVHHDAIIHDYASTSVAYGTIKGMLASDLTARWAATVTGIATRVARVYSALPMARVEQAVRVVEQYQSTSYLKRCTRFNEWYTPLDIVNSDRIWRFLSAMQTQKLARDKIDLEILEKLKRHELFVNGSLLTDVSNYATSVADSIVTNFNAKSTGFQTFAKFVRGEATDADIGLMRDPAVLTVFNSLVSVTFDALEKKDTIITLILIRELMEQIDKKSKGRGK